MARLTPFRVTYTDTAGTEITQDVTPIMGDLNMYDLIRMRHNWGPANESQQLSSSCMLWAALRRAGASVPDKFEVFATKHFVDLEPLDADGNVIEDDDPGQAVDPTHAAR